jgi:hypothetical protein
VTTTSRGEEGIEGDGDDCGEHQRGREVSDAATLVGEQAIAEQPEAGSEEGGDCDAGEREGREGAEQAVQLVVEIWEGGDDVHGEAGDEQSEETGWRDAAMRAGGHEPEDRQDQRGAEPRVAADPRGRPEQECGEDGEVSAGPQTPGEGEGGSEEQQACERFGERRAVDPHSQRRGEVEGRGEQRPRAAREQATAEGPKREHAEQGLEVQEQRHVLGTKDEAAGGQQAGVQVEELRDDVVRGHGR